MGCPRDRGRRACAWIDRRRRPKARPVQVRAASTARPIACVTTMRGFECTSACARVHARETSTIRVEAKPHQHPLGLRTASCSLLPCRLPNLCEWHCVVAQPAPNTARRTTLRVCTAATCIISRGSQSNLSRWSNPHPLLPEGDTFPTFSACARSPGCHMYPIFAAHPPY